MQLTGYAVTPVIKPAGDGLTNGLAVIAGGRGVIQTGQHGAFQQSLGINDQIILTASQLSLESPPLTAAPGFQKVLAPAPDGDRDHLVHRRMPTGNFGEAF